MRWKPLAWFLVSLLCFVAAVYFWQWGEQRAGQEGARPTEPTSMAPLSNDGTGDVDLVSQPATGTNGLSSEPLLDEAFPYRLRNTPAAIAELVRSESALLLENALVDTALARRLPVPDHLRSKGDPGTYIVQARGPITKAFRQAIDQAGGTVVSYVPNNAYLVRASAGDVALIEASPLTQSSMPFEPYYKLKGALLEMAVKQEELPRANLLSVVLFPDALEATVDALDQMGVVLVAEDRSPFGPVLKVQVPQDALAAVASLTGVQIVDRAYDRVLANDLSRERLGVSINSSNTANYLDLTGSNIVIQINDSGVDATHPDLTGRVTGDAPPSMLDTVGHGTHVAGTIAGDGKESATVAVASGSALPAVEGQFRGMAPEATLYSIGAIGGGVSAPDWFLQESAAENDALISNNSWNQLDASYNILAASYDAAVRDSLPEANGSQPVMYVFSAGNAGFGSEEGQGGFPDTILSPATAKNVITVGAIESLREITNEVLFCETVGTNLVCETNAPPFENETDTDWQVASFSSRGNVGIGLEGDFGRFKPDVVASGTFVISTRSGQWDEDAYYERLQTQRERNTIFSDPILPGEVNGYLAFIPENAVEFEVSVTTPAAQPPLPDLPIYVSTTGFPVPGDTPLGSNIVTLPPDAPLTPVDAIWYYGVGNPTDEPLFVNVNTVITTTNNNPVVTKGLQDLNAGLEPHYRYSSGTSMAAPAISGTLALMQEFFTRTYGTNPSPALLKALLINGSRSTSPTYDFQVNNVVNNQGWGIFNLPNVIPASTNLNGSAGAPVFFYDQSPTNALSTGQSHTRDLTLAIAAQNQSMRFTLVWTDPPGNPVVGAKLVNNLDLVVTNLDTGEVYFGNNIPAGSDFNQAYDPSTTNAVPDPDVVNNVENVFLPAFTGTNFTVTVVGRRVNVNAVYDHPDNTVQDYALVISSGNATVDAAITVTGFTDSSDPSATVNFLDSTLVSSNVVATFLEAQHAGENTPLLGTTNGIANQWHFYAMTNTSGFTNAAFITFLPSTLSIPRMGVFVDDPEDVTRAESDIDLYVSTDPALTTLDTAALAAADKSLGRGGTEAVVLDDAVGGTVYYIGVKSEDHEAANYRFFGAFSRLPFSEDDNGDLVLQGLPVPFDIPDGSPANPGAALVLAVATEPIEIRRVIVTNELSHQNMGDLIGNLSHDTEFAVLNNHTFAENDDTITNYTFIYEDNGEGDITGSQETDGPGSLKDFVGEEGIGVWLLTTLDDSLSQTGRVENVVVRLERSPDTNVYVRTIAPRSWFFDVINVPPEATNLTIAVEIIGTSPLPVELYIRKGDFPTFGLFDVQTTIYPPGGQASVSIFDLPPLVPDRYFFGIYNPNNVAQEVRITITIELGLDGRDRNSFTAFDEVPLIDNAVTYSTQFVEDDRRIAGLEVGLQVEHPRVSDLVTHLISPLGKRILLVENRGGTDTSGFGGGSVFTNAFEAFSGGADAQTNTIAIGANRGTLIVDYDFFVVADQMRVYYDGQEIKDTDLVSGSNTFSVDFGPGLSTDLEITMNEGNNSVTNTLWEYTGTVIADNLSYLLLTEDTNKTTTPIKFGVPPFGGLNLAATGTVVFADGFEGGVPGTYNVVGAAFSDGWVLQSGDVNLLATGAFGSTAYQGSQYLDLNGWGTGAIETNLALVPGRSYQLSFAYARNPDSVAASVIPEADFVLGTNTLTTISASGASEWTNLNWQTISVPFTVRDTNSLLQVQSLTAGASGVLLDAFEIREAAELDRPYLPEESLNALVGDSSEGLWTLEIWDNRAGAIAPGPALISWDLRFIYETIIQTPVPLEHGQPSTNTIPAGEILYLSVDVPNWASYATNTLIFATNDAVNVWFNQNRPPETTNVGDLLMLGPVNSGSFTLDTAGVPPPPLMPGQRYYIGIENPSTNAVTVAYQVEFDITTLSNGVPVSGTLGTNTFGGFIRYFSYDVSTNNPTALSLDLFNLSGDADLVARFGALPLPQYDYGSFNVGTNDDNITIFPDSTPVALQPGRWYLGVLLADSQPVDYTIQATELTNDFSGIITLTNAIPYSNSNLGIAPIEDYYRFMVTDPVARLQFDILGPTADMTLLVSKGLPLPSLADFDYLSANPGTNEEHILVLANSSPVIVSSGEWFLTALNLSGMAADYSIKATQWAETGQPITIFNENLQSNLFCFSWNSLVDAQYVVQAKVTLSDSNWVDHSGTITATAAVTGYCVPLPSPYHFFRVVEGVAVDPASPVQIRIIRISSGPGGVTLDWQAPPSFQFEVEYSDVLPPVWAMATGGPITSTDGDFTFTDDGTLTGGPPLPPIRYYRLVLLP